MFLFHTNIHTQAYNTLSNRHSHNKCFLCRILEVFKKGSNNSLDWSKSSWIVNYRSFILAVKLVSFRTLTLFVLSCRRHTYYHKSIVIFKCAKKLSLHYFLNKREKKQFSISNSALLSCVCEEKDCSAESMGIIVVMCFRTDTITSANPPIGT